MSFKFSGVNLIVHHFALKSALVGKNDFPFSSYRKVLGVMKISVALPFSAKISLSYPKQASIQCFLGGWSQKKQVDPALLHFFLITGCLNGCQKNSEILCGVDWSHMVLLKMKRSKR